MANTRKTIENLFISKVRIKALKYFFFHPQVPIHLRGAVREFGEEINAVRRELNRLEEVHILTIEQKGNRKYYLLNTEHPYYSDLLSIMHKTFGLGGDLVQSSKKLGDIKYAVLTSSYTKGVPLVPNDVDLVVVGNVDLNLLAEIVGSSEKRIGKEVNYTVLTDNDFDIRKKRRDSFVEQLVSGDHILLIGDKASFIS
jgi:hypothetical protein